MDVDGQRCATLSDQLRFAASKGQLNQVSECLQAGAKFDPDQVQLWLEPQTSTFTDLKKYNS